MGVLDKVVSAANRVGSKMAAAPTSEAEGIKATQANVKEYMDATAKNTPAPKAPTPTSNVDKLNSKAKFGDRPGEERMNVSDMTKPLAQYKHGTTNVPKTGAAMLHKGEAVIPAHENPMSGMFDKVAGMPSAKPPKVLDHIRTSKAKSGGYVHEHHFTSSEHKPETHVTKSMRDMTDHMKQHLGPPDMAEAQAQPMPPLEQE